MELSLLREGATELELPSSSARRGPGRRAAIFYNPSMRLDRDIQVAVGQALVQLQGRGGSGWEMLAATGVRGLRLLNESNYLSELWLTETGARASAVAERNALRYEERGARFRRWNARHSLPEGPFDFVDLDPYGSPIPFVDAALSSIRDEGCLAVTATDMLVLCGVQSGAAQRRYGARPLRGRLAPEAGLRILLAYLARAADRQGCSVEPLLSYVGDHHVRAYLRVHRRQDPFPPIGLAGGPGWTGPNLESREEVGPLWLGPLHQLALTSLLAPVGSAAEPGALRRWIETLRNEVTADQPFYYESNALARRLRLDQPPAVEPLLAALREEGFHAVFTQTRPGAFRTDAPRERVEALAALRLLHSQNARVRA